MRTVVALCVVALCYGNIWHHGLQKPQWPPLFTAAWNEQTSYSGQMKYSGGSAFYDFPHGNMNWTRIDGNADPICVSSVPLPYDTQCSHVVSNGNHYLYTPILNQCCMCCTQANGCGIPGPWSFDKLKYSSQSQYLGQAVYNWIYTANGATVTYVETVAKKPTDRKWVALFSPYDNYTNVWEFNTEVSDYFQLPAVCKGASLCGGVCEQVRDIQHPKLRATSENLFHGLPFF